MVKRFPILLFVVAFSITGIGQRYLAEIEEFETFANTEMAAQKIPGLSVGFIKEDFTWAKGFGYADLENNSPATEKSMYRLASVTKPMTAIAILQLVEKGKIDLDADVQKYVPYFPKKNYPVTVRNLLGHLGGISHYKDYSVEGHFKKAKSTKESLAVFQDWDLIAEPGTRFNYTSYGYNLLGAVIEGASGMSYGEYMRKFVWAPLGMETIVMDDPRRLIQNRVRGYEKKGAKVVNSEFVDISSRFAAGGTRASVIDMLRFGKGMMEGTVLNKGSRDFMFTSMLTKNGSMTYYGAGIGVAPTGGRYSLSHSGSQQETATYLYVFPSRDLVIAVAMNLEGANRIPIVSKLFEAVTGEAWEVKPYGVEPNLYRFMQNSFVLGRSYFERFGKSAVSDAEFGVELSRMLKRVSSTDEEIQTQLQNEASRPGSSFEKIGSFMAATLAESKGNQNLNSYSNTGCIAFFADYISDSESQGSPADKKITKDLAEKIKAYNESWLRTNTSENNSVRFSSTADITSASARLTNAFAGKSVYPDLSGEILAAAQTYAVGGDIFKALQLTRLGVELYPLSDETNANHGILLLLTGQKETGVKALRRSVSINPRGTASPQGLVGVAGQLFQIGMSPQGLQMLMVADDIHPSNALVLYRIGDYYRRTKDKTKAVEYFKKSLAVDPDFEIAKKGLKELMGTDQ